MSSDEGLSMTANKLPTSYRLSEECRLLLERLAETLGISQTGVIEQAVRKMARTELPGARKEKPAPKK